MNPPNNPITLIDRFIYPKPDGRHDLDIGLALTKAYQKTIREMERYARYVNREDIPITLTVAGDTKSGVRFLVQCEDAALQQRATEAIKSYLDKLDRDFLA